MKADEIHHFLLPGHGWAAVADRKEAKELRPDEVESLKAWRKQVLKAPTKAEAKRLTALAAGVETMWASAAERIRLTKRALRRDIDIYGAPSEKPGTSISRAEAIKALSDPDSALGRLRTLMDAWVGLWFWPLDTGVRPPSWGEWLAVAEDLVRPDERHGLTGQLDLFDDLGSLLDAERERQHGQLTVQQLRDGHPWLAVAVDAARTRGRLALGAGVRPRVPAGRLRPAGREPAVGATSTGTRISCSPSATRGGASPTSRAQRRSRSDARADLAIR